jgi:hypothetical protein
VPKADTNAFELPQHLANSGQRSLIRSLPSSKPGEVRESGGVCQSTSFGRPAVLGHRDDLVVGDGDDEIAPNAAIGSSVLPEFEDCFVAGARNEPDVASDSFSLVYVLRVHQGRTRPVGAASIGSMTPPPAPGTDAFPLLVVGHQRHKWLDVPVVQRVDCVLEVGDIAAVHDSYGCVSDPRGQELLGLRCSLSIVSGRLAAGDRLPPTRNTARSEVRAGA